MMIDYFIVVPTMTTVGVKGLRRVYSGTVNSTGSRVEFLCRHQRSSDSYDEWPQSSQQMRLY